MHLETGNQHSVSLSRANQFRLALIACCAFASCGSALAQPRCDDGGFALVYGRWISSEWCQEELAAQLSRKRHWGYTAAQLHNNPKAMEEFCRGNADIRFTDACASNRD